MRREIIGLLFAAALAARFGVARAQPTTPVRTVGILTGPVRSAHYDALRQGLRELGWIEGRNLRLEIRYVSGPEHAPAALAELVRMAVDVIHTGGPQFVTAARAATGSIPIVFWLGVDPVSTGLVESYSRPGGNVTGIAGSAAEALGKQVELLFEAVPRIKRVALLIHPDRPTADASIGQAQQAANDLGLQLQVVKARNAPEVAQGLAEVRRTAADALVMAAAGPLRTEYERIAAFAIANRLPMIAGYSSDSSLDAACLLRYGASYAHAMRRVAHYIDRILNGARPADLPVERAARFHLIVNLKVATAIGVVVPDTLLRIADEVIE